MGGCKTFYSIIAVKKFPHFPRVHIKKVKLCVSNPKVLKKSGQCLPYSHFHMEARRRELFNPFLRLIPRKLILWDWDANRRKTISTLRPHPHLLLRACQGVCVCCVLHFSPLNLSKQEKVSLLIFYLETASPASRTLCRLALLYKTRQRRKFPSIALQSTTPFSLTSSNRLLQVTCVSEGTDFLLAAWEVVNKKLDALNALFLGLLFLPSHGEGLRGFFRFRYFTHDCFGIRERVT